MVRRSSAAVERDALDSLLAVLGRLGIGAEVVAAETLSAGRRADAVVEVAGRVFDVEVESVVTAAGAERLAQTAARPSGVIVVADRIAAAGRESLRRSGVNYFDRRGELRIVELPVVIDTVVEPEAGPVTRSRGSLDSQVAKEVAIACLLTPDQPHGVREIARYIDRAPSAVSAAMAGLRQDGLLTSAGEAMIPDLFEELLGVWRRQTVSLAALPDPDARTAMRLGLGVDEAEETMGWALTDTRAGASWGMPVVARGDYPPDFYVPAESDLRTARRILGEAADSDVRACTVAVAPVRLVCLRRFDQSNASGEPWPVANHVVVALDIAQDRARGLEVLEQWQPEGIVRAW